MMTADLLRMNTSRILFLHPDETGLGSPHAVQITIVGDSTQKQNVETDLITKLAILHLQDPLPQSFTVEGRDYTLLAGRKEWPFGKSNIYATWGDEEVVPCDEKWKFVFTMKDTLDIPVAKQR
ncbi:hypothetical protein BDW22DRAFT_748026 [Trametopsis cervina]|nr:hypothetical protein BDW22DRAFT_748026 [Trametopsis cervina]